MQYNPCLLCSSPAPLIVLLTHVSRVFLDHADVSGNCASALEPSRTIDRMTYTEFQQELGVHACHRCQQAPPLSPPAELGIPAGDRHPVQVARVTSRAHRQLFARLVEVVLEGFLDGGLDAGVSAVARVVVPVVHSLGLRR